MSRLPVPSIDGRVAEKRRRLGRGTKIRGKRRKKSTTRRVPWSLEASGTPLYTRTHTGYTADRPLASYQAPVLSRPKIRGKRRKKSTTRRVPWSRLVSRLPVPSIDGRVAETRRRLGRTKIRGKPRKKSTTRRVPLKSSGDRAADRRKPV